MNFKWFSQKEHEYLSFSSPSLFSVFFKTNRYLALHLMVSIGNEFSMSINCAAGRFEQKMWNHIRLRVHFEAGLGSLKGGYTVLFLIWLLASSTISLFKVGGGVDRIGMDPHSFYLPDLLSQCGSGLRCL